MRKIKIISLLVLLFGIAVFNSQARMITIEGTYQGENLFIYNPYDKDRNQYQVKYILVNSTQMEKTITSAIEVDLANYKMGDYILVQIHVEDLEPGETEKFSRKVARVLNPNALRSKSTFEMVYIDVSADRMKWTTKNENNQEPYIIEVYMNNRWEAIGKVIGKGSEGFNNYAYPIKHASPGAVLRIKKRDLSNYAYTEPVTYIPVSN